MPTERSSRLPKGSKSRRAERPSPDEKVPRVTLADLYWYAQEQMRAGRGDYTIKVVVWQFDAEVDKPEHYGRLFLDEIEEDDILKEIYLYYRV